MAGTLVQVLPDQGDWKIDVDGEQRGGTYSTQAEAEQEGRRIAKELDAEFQLHAGTGNIRDKDSYGNDPSDIEG